MISAGRGCNKAGRSPSGKGFPAKAALRHEWRGVIRKPCPADPALLSAGASVGAVPNGAALFASARRVPSRSNAARTGVYTRHRLKSRRDLTKNRGCGIDGGMNQPFPSYKTAPVDSLVPYARNSRTHSADQIRKIAASIKEFGFLNPVIVDGANGIIAGHGRVLAAKQIGMTEVPVVEAGHLTDAQRRAYVIADNRLALDAGWDDTILKMEMGDLQGMGFDIGLTGFDLREIARITAGGLAGSDPDAEVEPEAEAVSVLGDVWTLGDHRIICGDSTDPATVAAVLGDARPHLMVTDPPYGVEYDAQWRNEVLRADGSRVGARAVGKVKNDDRADWSAAYALFPGDVAYVWHAGLRAADFWLSLEASGFVIRSQIIWAKSQLAIGQGNYHMQHEPCWYAVRKGKTGHWAGDRKQTTLWQIDKPRKSETGHSTQKPVECMKRPMENNSRPGDYVYEPFSGSGTTIIAAEMTGRKCLAVELHPQYVDLAVRRWQTFTGKTAMLGDKTFAEVEAERHVQPA